MTREEFDQMVSALELEYRGRHAALVRRAIWFAALGYGGLALALLLSMVLCAAAIALLIFKLSFVTIKLALVIGVPAGIVTVAIIKGLWIRLAAPEGQRMTRRDAPKLFALIDDISRQAGGVNFHEILITNDLNAAVVQIPRLGVFGWYRTYLILGLPLMDALAPDEFKAVVAHEFAHLSHQDGRLGSWIYRLRSSWEKVMASLAERGAPRPLLAFVNWFWPRFNASAFVLSRSQEYQADAFAAKVTSPHASACGLQRLAVESRRLSEHFWDDIGRQTSHRPSPPDDVFHRMQSFLGAEPDRGLATRWLAGALAMATNTADTHPSLTDRLAALGVTATAGNVPALPDKRASDEWLEPAQTKEARDRFSRAWLDDVSSQWQATHLEKQELKKRLETPPASTPGAEWDRLLLRARIDGPASIQTDLTDFLAAHPDHPVANYFRGVHLAERDDDAALPFLERATVRPDLLMDALGAMAGLYDRTGRSDLIRDLRRRADAHQEKMQRAHQERNIATPGDAFLPPDLTGEEMASVVNAVSRHKQVRAAWLVRKTVEHFPEWRSYVLALDIRWPALSLAGNVASMEILRQILDDLHVDAYFLALLRDSKSKPVVKAIERTEGAALSFGPRQEAV